MSHTKCKLVFMEKPPASFEDHGWRSIAMCGQKFMVAARKEDAIHVEGGIVVSGINNEANARRLVACWNACEGSPTEGLEEMVSDGRSVANMAMLYERAMDRRDELLAAMKLMRPFILDESLPSKFWSAPFADAVTKYDAAIAKAESK